MAALRFWPSQGTIAPQHTRVANGQWHLGEGAEEDGPWVTTSASLSFALKPRCLFLFVVSLQGQEAAFPTPNGYFSGP